jgi:crotonobetainyl-CoA:carnitine CoA-transferase CaiB-like acyl-CoA transferase
LRQLVDGADVVIENFLPAARSRLRVNVPAMLQSHPRLIWCTIAGFPREADRPGYDFVVQAESGWMAVTGDPEGEPTRGPVAIADVLTGKDAAIAILAALLRRELAATFRQPSVTFESISWSLRLPGW